MRLALAPSPRGQKRGRKSNSRVGGIAKLKGLLTGHQDEDDGRSVVP